MLKRLATVCLCAVVLLLGLETASAHQPFFEETDFTAVSPFTIADVSISTAVYATLDRKTDVDYYTFEAQQGQTIQLEMTIPQIDGLEAFAPTMALLGPGLAEADLPLAVVVPEGSGGQLIAPTEAVEFYEPFGGQYYWDRQEARIEAPQTAVYTVAVWHASGDMGRYVFVAGSREIPGGDPAYRSKIESYWTLPEPTVEVEKDVCRWAERYKK